MKITIFTLLIGILFIVAGILGFIPLFVQAPHIADPSLIVEQNHGRLLGLFSVNIIHNVVHLILGVWAVSASRRFETSRIYCKVAGCFYGLLVVMGTIPKLDTVFGLIPVEGHDVWLHLIFTIPLLYFGFSAQHKESFVMPT